VETITLRVYRRYMYKDTQKQREANKDANKRYRDKKGITQQGITEKGITLLKRPNGDDYDPNEMLGNRPRYMVMKDGQVLDRQTLPYKVDIPKTKVKEDRTYPAIVYALADPVKRAKLRKICQELKNHNVLKDVQYGTGGPTMDTVAEMLTAF